MLNKHYLFALAALALIPIVTVLGGALFSLINPEIAAGHANYERNYQLLELFRTMIMFGVLLADVALWFLVSFFLLKAKRRSSRWLMLALLGPFGLAVLTMLGEKAQEYSDCYQRFVRKLNIYLRIAYEAGVFLILGELAYQTMVLKRNLTILYEAYARGIPTAQIIDQQNASSGMWAFSEGLETLFLLALFYLLRPILFNWAARLFRS